MRIYFKSLEIPSATLIPSEFIDDYMAESNGEYVKVYLYLLRHAARDISYSEVADKLDLMEGDVTRAISYWMRTGLISVDKKVKYEAPKEAIISPTKQIPYEPSDRNRHFESHEKFQKLDLKTGGGYADLEDTQDERFLAAVDTDKSYMDMKDEKIPMAGNRKKQLGTYETDSDFESVPFKQDSIPEDPVKTQETFERSETVADTDGRITPQAKKAAKVNGSTAQNGTKDRAADGKNSPVYSDVAGKNIQQPLTDRQSLDSIQPENYTEQQSLPEQSDKNDQRKIKDDSKPMTVQKHESEIPFEESGLEIEEIVEEEKQPQIPQTQDAVQQPEIPPTITSQAISFNTNETSPGVSPVPDKAGVNIFKLKDNEEFANLLYVVQRYLSKIFSQSDTESVAYIYDVLKMPTDLIEYLAEMCAEKGKTSLRYMEAVAVDWHSKGICTVEQAKNTQSIYTSETYSVMKALGISDRNPGTSEQEMIRKWFNTYAFSKDIVLEACKRTLVATGKPSFPYADSILTSWKKAGVRVKKDIDRLDSAHEEKQVQTRSNTTKPQKASGSRFNNFEQRNDDLDSMVVEQMNRRLNQ